MSVFANFPLRGLFEGKVCTSRLSFEVLSQRVERLGVDACQFRAMYVTYLTQWTTGNAEILAEKRTLGLVEGLMRGGVSHRIESVEGLALRPLLPLVPLSIANATFLISCSFHREGGGNKSGGHEDRGKIKMGL